ncbi:MAG: hypothetical protein JWN56_1134 [Sphingobacteriales bacterium]|nr:hypothetical protein [Sphingobacteriales bacterium]
MSSLFSFMRFVIIDDIEFNLGERHIKDSFNIKNNMK